jgi:ribosomal protein S18 acetylase RimI-like enzyme
MQSARNRALPPGVEIRPAESRDVRRLRIYFVSLSARDRWLRFVGNYRPSSHDLQKRLGTILVAVDTERGEVVGELMFDGECWPLGYEDFAVSVDPDYRTHRIASELFRTWLLGTRSRFVRFVVAEQVRRKNRPAEAFLRSHGFVESASDPDAPLRPFVLDRAALVVGYLETMGDGGAGLQSEPPVCDGFAFRLGGPNGLVSPDQLPRATAHGALVACVEHVEALADALAAGGWQDVASRLLITSPDERAIALARAHGLAAGGEQLALIVDDRSQDLNAVLSNPAVLGVITNRPAALKRLRNGQN